jgi:hypothetical protein
VEEKFSVDRTLCAGDVDVDEMSCVRWLGVGKLVEFKSGKVKEGCRTVTTAASQGIDQPLISQQNRPTSKTAPAGDEEGRLQSLHTRYPHALLSPQESHL